ncbi:MAG: exonuclease SbcCD subunit D C-terminal domain-containing protein [ANME-2 cluster archaeon]|nr:exonuclease SbcCD subunit D C-terminal domain-containing protein [ANME-2 cluster archaeon]
MSFKVGHMRILHTSDWHIGQKIYEQNRLAEHEQFLDWLLDTIIEREVDILLVCGDVFDSSVPPAGAADLYYRFLFDLYKKTTAYAVIIAGNHDSAVRLAAPREFLQMARIHVVGNISESARECVVRLDVNGTSAAIAAVPYLNEGDILPHVSLEGEVERSMRYREAVKKVYEECLSTMDTDIRVLMGHYFIQGGTSSDSERLVQIGGINPVRTTDLPPADYIALGHLHRPQHIQGNGCPVVYSGSPLPLSFKEAGYDKKIFLIDIRDECTIEEVTVPVFRELVRLEGTRDDLMARANFEDWKDKYIEVNVHLDGPAIGTADTLRKAFALRGGKVLVVESVLPSRKGESLSPEDIKTKSPEEIFCDFYRFTSDEDASPEALDELLTTFNELMEFTLKEETREEET